MMAFIVKVILSFVVGGGYIAFTIYASERFGSRAGGILAGLPSTILVGVIFIAWTLNPAAVREAMPVVPIVTAVNTILVAIFIYFFKKGFVRACVLALAVWALLTLPFVIIHIQNMPASLLIAAAFMSIGIRYLRRFPHRNIQRVQLTVREHGFRIVFAGMIIALVVILSKVGGPIWGGLFSSFPAALSSLLIILSRKYGIEFTSSVARSMPFGVMSCIVFSLVLYLLIPLISFIFALIIAYAFSLLYAILFYKLSLSRFDLDISVRHHYF